MNYDTERIEELARQIARFELPRVSSVETKEFVTSYEKKLAWYTCHYCGTAIQRSLQYANRTFTCYDCRRENQRKYDNTLRRVKIREERRIIEKLISRTVPLSEEEQKRVLIWNSRNVPKKKPYRRLRRFQKNNQKRT